MGKEVLVYVKEGCPYCYRLISIFKDRKIKFREIDVYSESEEADNAVTRNGKKPVPQVEFNGRIIYDYSTEEKLADEVEAWFKG